MTKLSDKGLAPATGARVSPIALGNAGRGRRGSASLIGRHAELSSSARLPNRAEVLKASEVERLAEGDRRPLRPADLHGRLSRSAVGELAGLKVERLILLKRQASIAGTPEEVRGQLRHVDETKTSASRRLVTLPPFLCEILAAQLERSSAEFVFTSSTGALLAAPTSDVTSSSLPLKSVGLNPEMRFHDLRHMAALMIEPAAHPKRDSGPRRTCFHQEPSGDLRAPGPTLGAHLGEALDRAHPDAKRNLPRPVRSLDVIGPEPSETGNAS